MTSRMTDHARSERYPSAPAVGWGDRRENKLIRKVYFQARNKAMQERSKS